MSNTTNRTSLALVALMSGNSFVGRISLSRAFVIRYGWQHVRCLCMYVRTTRAADFIITKVSTPYPVGTSNVLRELLTRNYDKVVFACFVNKTTVEGKWLPYFKECDSAGAAKACVLLATCHFRKW